ncbi:MAG: hypothetical protein JWM54_1323 [Acidobacteriaceae bacterium]|jgi:hypothetical protein|nr:hypothetical protein [Acidobacteriaceae bacterium]
MNRIATRQTHLLYALCALCLFALHPAHAQTGLYGGFNAAKVNQPSNKWAYGGLFGIYSDFAKVPPVRVGGDLRFSVLRLDSNTTLFSTLIGPRVAFHPPAIPLTPYAEILIGTGRYSFGNNVGSATKFQYEVLGGVDRPLVPHLDWRVVEFSYSRLATVQRQRLSMETLTTGLVLRF